MSEKPTKQQKLEIEPQNFGPTGTEIVHKYAIDQLFIRCDALFRNEGKSILQHMVVEGMIARHQAQLLLGLSIHCCWCGLTAELRSNGKRGKCFCCDKRMHVKCRKYSRIILEGSNFKFDHILNLNTKKRGLCYSCSMKQEEKYVLARKKTLEEMPTAVLVKRLKNDQK